MRPHVTPAAVVATAQPAPAATAVAVPANGSRSVVANVQARRAAADAWIGRFAGRYSVTVLRLALGFVFVLFGALKFFPGLSPAQGIATDVMTTLTFGLLPAQPALLAVAVAEVSVGLCLLVNRGLSLALWFLAFEMLAILSPIVLFPGQLFSGPHHLPSLLGQYILKDFVLVGGVLVLFAQRRGDTVRPIAETDSAAGR